MGRIVAQAPRAPQPTLVSKAAQRIQTNRLVGQQQSMYAPHAFVRPATMDAAAASFSTSYSSYLAPALMRLKGVDRRETFTGAEFIVIVGAAPETVNACVVICEYEEDASGITISEITRALVTQVISTTSITAVTATFINPVTLDPGRKYAVGLSHYTLGAGAAVVGASASAVATIRLTTFSFGSLNTRVDLRFDGSNNAQAEWVERGSGSFEDRPLITLVGPSSSQTARWY